MNRIYLAGVCLLLLVWQSALTLSGDASAAVQKAQKGQKKDKDNPNLLSMEVQALETLHNFEATVPQLNWIAQVAKGTKAKLETRDPARVGADYVNVLKNLRVALIANNQDQIEKLQEELEKIAEKNPPELDNEFDITDAARKEVDGLYKMLSVHQLVIYADSFGDDLNNIADPVKLIVTGLEDTQKLKDKEWQEERDDLADEVSWLVGGLDRNKTAKLRGDVAAFLTLQHGKPFKAGELEPKIRKIIGAPDPLVLLRNLLKHDLALLLSNPLLERAVQDRLKKAE
jgi:hypothetical protein